MSSLNTIDRFRYLSVEVMYMQLPQEEKYIYYAKKEMLVIYMSIYFP
jgi:hypothetical protein